MTVHQVFTQEYFTSSFLPIKNYALKNKLYFLNSETNFTLEGASLAQLVSPSVSNHGGRFEFKYS